MALEQLEVTRYQNVAVQFCYRLGEDAYEQRMDTNGCLHPLWMDYATRMAELHMMAKMLREHGFDI